MSKWKCCKKEPSETGKKVLCCKEGDIYVAMRFGEYYVPIPFADHYFSISLSKPDTWCEIDFPDGLTGHLRVLLANGKDMIVLSELEVDYPEEFKEFAKMVISSIGKLKKPEKKN